MTGEPGENSICALCGGRLRPGLANVPFTFPEAVVVVKGVPAEICGNCREPYMDSLVAERVTEMVHRIRACGAEVSVVTYCEGDITEAIEPAPAKIAA